jgi:hypothetical protein
MNSVRSAMRAVAAVPKTADEREMSDGPMEETAEQNAPSTPPAFNRSRFAGFKKS